MNYDFLTHNTALIFNTVSLSICLCIVLVYAFSDSCRLLLKQHNALIPLLLALSIIYIFSIRVHAGDSFMYVWAYKTSLRDFSGEFSWKLEWFWYLIAALCRRNSLSPESWLTIIAIGYIGFTYVFCKKMLWENVMMAFLFFISTFTFCSYGINTLRQGFACSMILFGMSCWYKNNNIWICAACCLLAFGTHRSTSLVTVALFLANTIIKKPKLAIMIWFLSLVVSLVFGNFLMNYAGAMNFDSRIEGYSSTTTTIYKAGFRWDFLLYGFIPILFFWYISIKKGIQDLIFNKLCITYTLANAMWLQFIRMPYTDRIAYLSWFMLPAILAYGVIRVPIWKDQDRKAAGILALVGLFSFIMNFR